MAATNLKMAVGQIWYLSTLSYPYSYLLKDDWNINANKEQHVASTYKTADRTTRKMYIRVNIDFK